MPTKSVAIGEVTI